MPIHSDLSHISSSSTDSRSTSSSSSSSKDDAQVTCSAGAWSQCATNAATTSLQYDNHTKHQDC
jgi:hypothetical protein